MTHGALTLYEKLWRQHVIASLDESRAVLRIDRMVIHESSSRDAFETMRRTGRRARNADQVLGVIDHTVSTAPGRDPSSHPASEGKIRDMMRNCGEFGIRLFGIDDPLQGITHVVAPEVGLTLPGSTVVCPDSHTSTNGALGALAWGIGTSEIAQVLATQSLVQRKLKVMRIRFDGTPAHHVTAKDLILSLIGRYGTTFGKGHAVEYCGAPLAAQTIEQRMTVCNLTVEFGARLGFIAPDDRVFDYLHDKPFSPRGDLWNAAVEGWCGLRTDDEATFDREVTLDCTAVGPQVTWGTSPKHVLDVDARVPDPADSDADDDRTQADRALSYMGLKPGDRIEGLPIDVAFIGSCTNGRISDLKAAASVVRGRKVAQGVRALVVPGSTSVKREAEALGLHDIFRDAGFEWRESGCSMCLAANGDVVAPKQRCISTSNRNFENRQGPESRTHLASPATVAASAIQGRITDIRKFMDGSV